VSGSNASASATSHPAIAAKERKAGTDLTLAIVICLLLPATAAAEDFPTKPIRLIATFPPDGPNDIIARVIGQRMSGAGTHPSSDANSSSCGRGDRIIMWGTISSGMRVWRGVYWLARHKRPRFSNAQTGPDRQSLP
jgi:hypothetical protein